MVRCASNVIIFFCLLSTQAWADDRVYFESEDERRWNTPPKLTPEQADGKSNFDNESPQPRFLPFSASFTLSSGGTSNNAHSLSVGGSQDGISFSQSASQAASSAGIEGSTSVRTNYPCKKCPNHFVKSRCSIDLTLPQGQPYKEARSSGISASQSSSFAAGLSGISGSDSNAFDLSHPAFGGNSQANSNSFALGQATSSSQGNVVKGQAGSGAQSSVGSSHSSATSGASANSGVANFHGQNNRRGKPSWTNIGPNHEIGGLYNPNGGRPKLHVTQGHHGFSEKRPGKGPLRLDVNLDDDRWQHRRPEVFITEQRPTNVYRGHRQGGSYNGGFHSSATSLSNSQQNWGSNQDASVNHESWTQSPLTGPHPGSWSQAQDSNRPGLQISGASASSSANSNSPGSSSFGQSSSHSGLGPNGPSSWTNNNAQTSGNAQSHAQGAAAAVGQNNGNAQASFSSGAIAGSSQGNGYSQGNAVSANRGQNSRGQVASHSTGSGQAQGTANSGSVSFVTFPNSNDPQNLPREFVRNSPSNSRNGPQGRVSRTRDPVGELLTDITDTVVDLFDI